GAPGTVDLGDVLVPVGRTIVGRVVLANGDPVAEGRLEMTGANADRGRLRVGEPAIEMSWYGAQEESKTAVDGRFAFVDLAPGRYEIGAGAAGMSSQHATVTVEAAADPAPVEIRFPAGRSVRVTVVDDEGVPVPWAYLFVE